MRLVDKYRPRKLAELRGQSWIVQQLQAFVECPHSCAFLFDGPTGTGKTSAAILLAEALGVAVAESEFGGLYQIASGEQSGESVRKVMASMHCHPFFGSGWRVLIVNEADAMNPERGLHLAGRAGKSPAAMPGHLHNQRGDPDALPAP